jgi:hypothetical protein
MHQHPCVTSPLWGGRKIASRFFGWGSRTHNIKGDVSCGGSPPAKNHACASRHGPSYMRGRTGRAPDSGTARGRIHHRQYAIGEARRSCQSSDTGTGKPDNSTSPNAWPTKRSCARNLSTNCFSRNPIPVAPALRPERGGESPTQTKLSCPRRRASSLLCWIPAFAGMTKGFRY